MAENHPRACHQRAAAFYILSSSENVTHKCLWYFHFEIELNLSWTSHLKKIIWSEKLRQPINCGCLFDRLFAAQSFRTLKSYEIHVVSLNDFNGFDAAPELLMKHDESSLLFLSIPSGNAASSLCACSAKELGITEDTTWMKTVVIAFTVLLKTSWVKYVNSQTQLIIQRSCVKCTN